MTGNGGNVGRALGWCGRVFAFGSAAYYVGYFAVWRWEVNRGYFDAPESLVIPAFFLALAFIAACLTIRRHFAVLWISNLPVLAVSLLAFWALRDWAWWMGLPLSVSASVLSLWVPIRRA